MKDRSVFGARGRGDLAENSCQIKPTAPSVGTRGCLFSIPRHADVESHREQFVATPTAPLPPEHLIKRAGGDANVSTYLRTGHLMARSIDELLHSRTIAVKENARVLDFGCGSGRLAAWLRLKYLRWELHGTDRHAESVAWAQSNLEDIGRFACNLDVPPLPYWDGFFDLVIAFFVFTQPDDELQSEWFEELVRVTRPGGHLIVSVPQCREPGLKGALSSAKHSANTNTGNWSSFYRSNHLATDFIRQAWSKFVRIEQIVPRWLNRDDALVICRR